MEINAANSKPYIYQQLKVVIKLEQGFYSSKRLKNFFFSFRSRNAKCQHWTGNKLL